MRTNLRIALLVYAMVQVVLFGVPTAIVLATGLAENAATLIPWIIGVSFVIAVPVSLLIAPQLKADHELSNQPVTQPGVDYRGVDGFSSPLR